MSSWKMQQGRILRCYEFVRCFFGVFQCSGTSWFREYTSQISMSNISFHVEKVTIKTLWGTLMKSMNLDLLTPSFELP